MKRLGIYMILFSLLLAAPLGVVSWHAYMAFDREADSQMRFFSGQLLDGMEAELAQWVQREEARAVDEYQHTRIHNGRHVLSPLSRIPEEPFILGYFQNDPDGGFQTPLAMDPNGPSADAADRSRRLFAMNTLFNQRKTSAGTPVATGAGVQRAAPVKQKEQMTGFADRYLNTQKSEKQVLGQTTSRKEAITASQAMQIAGSEPRGPALHEDASVFRQSSVLPSRAPGPQTTAAPVESDRFQVEVAPLQAVSLNADHVFIFRRVDINGRIYRQGFVLTLQPFLEYLAQRHYDPQPLSRYTGLSLRAGGIAISRSPDKTRDRPETSSWMINRIFPSPFGFLAAQMHGIHQPPSPAQNAFTVALILLGGVMMTGLFSIYQSARSIRDLSERRSRFVSTVTHELKTPLTTIRMYIEMLEQGIAATPEQEQAYLGILLSESARLSGLITNVLALSRLEKKDPRLTFSTGDLSDVLTDVRAIMGDRLLREGFSLDIHTTPLPVFAYDREVLVQVVVNLVENSIKFGLNQPEKRIVIAVEETGGKVTISVRDTGPGIPKPDLERVFDEFYRVDNALVRSTSGTGIGLALVKKFITAMGGTVRAKNNADAGCAIIFCLPANRSPCSHTVSREDLK